jgi:hypothetical protein
MFKFFLSNWTGLSNWVSAAIPALWLATSLLVSRLFDAFEPCQNSASLLR